MKTEEIRKRVLENSPVLAMNRVPKQTAEAFKEFAKQEFCDDYGMAFKYIWDRCWFLDQLVQTAMLQPTLQQHEQRLSKLESQEGKNKVIKMADGREVELK